MGLFPSASDAQGRQGFVRLINRSGQAGEMRIEAFDDAGVGSGPVTLDIGAEETVHFNSEDLEGGNAGKGLSGGVGSGTGDWRLRLSSSLELQVLAYIRTGDGFLTAMHDVAPSTEAGHRVVTFNPGKNTAQASRLRLINPGAETAEVRITGIDDKGESPGGAVELSVPAGAARTLGAQQLESGEGAGLTGAAGHGGGVQVAAGTVDYENMERFLGLLGEDVTPVTLTPQTLFDTVTMAPLRKTLRRAALIFAGRVPTDAEYAVAQGGPEALRATIRGLMTGSEFHEFLIRGSNDRLLTERERYVLSNDGFLVAYANEFVRQQGGSARDRRQLVFPGVGRVGAVRCTSSAT